MSQKKIFTASLNVTAKSPTEVAERARVIVETAGGFISGQDSSGSGVDSVSMVLKVPPEKLGPVLSDLAKLGKETDRTLKGEDVTGQVVDLDARIVTARASVERVRAFLGATKNVGELAGIEAELTRRETDLEVLVGQQRTLADQVDLATVTLVVSERPIVVAAKPGDFLKSVPGFGDALAGGFNALVAALRVLAAGVGYVLPFVAMVGLGIALRRLVRAVRAGRNTQSLKVRSS